MSAFSDKGATPQQNQIAGSQQSFMNTLQNDFGTAFAGSQNIINGLTKSLQTQVAAGPSQFGFSQAELSALNTLATTGNSQAYQNAKAAAGSAEAAVGGTAQIPSGAAGETQSQIASAAAINESNALLSNQLAGFEQGNKNYENATKDLTGVAALENPTALASTANTAGGEASTTAAQIQKENQAANPWTQIGGLVGSLGGAALNAFVPGAGSLVNNATNPTGSLNPQFAATQYGSPPSSPTGWDSGLYPTTPDLSVFNPSSYPAPGSGTY